MIEITNFDGTRVEKVLTEIDKGVTIKKIWENASPNSNFSQQTVRMSIPTEAYVVVLFRAYSTRRASVIVKVGTTGIMMLAMAGAGFAPNAEGEPFTGWRSVDVTTAGLTFSQGASYLEYRNDMCVPVSAYIIKGVN